MNDTNLASKYLVLEALQRSEGRGVTSTGLACVTSLPRSQVMNALNKLITENLVEKSGHHSHTRYSYITEERREYLRSKEEKND
jgi:DNA-binding IclR family transcriptional regulator